MTTVFKQVLIVSFSLVSSAFAIVPNPNPADAAVICSPVIKFQSQIFTVQVAHGLKNIPAIFDYGSFGRSTRTEYRVERTQSRDLRYDTYKGPDFYLFIDEVKNVATLKATVKGQVITQKDLRCEFHEFNNHPGVTISN